MYSMHAGVCIHYGCPGNCKWMTKRVRSLEIVVLLNGGRGGVNGMMAVHASVCSHPHVCNAPFSSENKIRQVSHREANGHYVY